MIKLDKDKIQVRYITGINKTIFDYPTALDVLYDSCTEGVDDNLFSRAKMENKYSIFDDDIDRIINELLDSGFIVENKSKYKIIKTPWD